MVIMKRISAIVLVVLTAVCCVSQGPLKVDTPERPAGQEDAVLMTAPPMDVVRVGFIGLGMRGADAVSRFLHIPGVRIAAVCDVEPDRVARVKNALDNIGYEGVATYTGDADSWKQLCEQEDVDLVYVVTDWKTHAAMGVYAMEHGKHVAIEVPAAMTLDEIWSLVDTSERTRKHCMQLENCVYDIFELTTLNMAQHGIFGEILHVEGSYIHNLEDFWGAYWNNWRLDYNREFRGDVYPTHGLGPACQLLDIHRGDRMKTLVAMDTKAVTGPKLVEKYTGEKCDDFKNADHTLTMISTEKGKTILIQHNVMTPRPYSRMYQLTGTEGFANKYPVQQYCFRSDGKLSDLNADYQNLNMHGAVPADVMAKLMEEYKHPIHKEIEDVARKVGGHGGMDYVMDYRLIYCLRNGLPLDMDVYDLAEWCCLPELTRLSLENGNVPVQVPDFTRGAWNKVQGYRHSF